MGAAIPASFSYGVSLSELQVENVATDATQEYQALEINNIAPEEILPII